MSEKQELRQALNKIDLVGLVKEHKLNKGKTKDKGNEKNYINGSLVIKTGEYSEIELALYVEEKNKDGKIKKNYEVLEGFINEEHLTLAGCKSEEDRENVAKVKVFGNKDFCPHFSEDIFKVKETGEVINKIKVDLSFGTIKVDNLINEEDYKAEFDIEMYVTSITEEEKEQELTGRAIVKGWTPIYGGKVMPMTILAENYKDEDGGNIELASDLLNVEAGSTLNLWGNINYQKIVTKVKKGGSMGKAKIEEKTEYVNDLVAIGADIIEDEEKEFDGELVKKAKLSRDETIEEIKNEKAKENNKGKGMNSTNSEDKPKRTRPNF